MTNLFPAMTLGSGSDGKGITLDNVSSMNLVYIRKVGYGVKNIDEMREKYSYKESIEVEGKKIEYNENNKEKNIEINENDLKNMIEKIIKEIRLKS